MTGILTELERLEKAAQDAHGRFLRLETFHDVQVVEAAHALWKSAVAALDDCRGREKNASPEPRRDRTMMPVGSNGRR